MVTGALFQLGLKSNFDSGKEIFEKKIKKESALELLDFC